MAKTEGKTPLQDEKEKTLDTLLDQKKEGADKADRKEPELAKKETKPDAKEVKKRKVYVRKKKVVAPPADPEALKKEGMFFIDLMGNGRRSVGIEKPIPESSQQMFVSSYALLVLKYGDVATRWMPEVMMSLCLIVIGADTLTEYRKLKPKKKKEIEKKEPEPEIVPSIDEQMGKKPEEKAL